jgi:pentapeptide repeat protein
MDGKLRSIRCFIFAALLLVNFQIASQAEETCTGPFKGRTLTKDELLSSHALEASIIPNASCVGPVFERRNLCGIVLEHASFPGAVMLNADLSGARLQWSDFTGADFGFANLRGADLSNAILSGARFQRADVANATFQVSAEQRLPQAENWALVRGLSDIRIVDPKTLIAFQGLRQELKSAGLRNEERAVTAAIQRTIMRNDGPPERMVKQILFELTSHYGANPFRPSSCFSRASFSSQSRTR